MPVPQAPFRAGILGAGLGSRLNSSAGAKPLAPIKDGRSLLELLLESLRHNGVYEIACALRGEQISPDMRKVLPRAPGLTYLYADTPSSLHTLAELIRKLGTAGGSVLFSMADTVILPEDFARFVEFCAQLPTDENAVLVTPFVDDESPLWVDVNEKGLITRFGSEEGRYVTSGMYFLSRPAMERALADVAAGTHKMRNFLSNLAKSGSPVHAFVVSKTIDVDHPSDLEKAAQFLGTDQGKSS